MKSSVITFSLWMLILAALPVNSFGKRHSPPPDPKFLAIGQIVILPVVDARAGQKGKVDLNSALRKTAQKNLKSKNYAVIVSDSIGNVGEVVEEDLNDAKPEWIKRLGPPEARWVMLVGLRDVHSKITFGSTGNAEVFGSLYDKDSGSTIWSGTGVGQVGQGGLLGMAMKGAMSTSAIQTATFNLLGSIPKVPKKK